MSQGRLLKTGETFDFLELFIKVLLAQFIIEAEKRDWSAAHHSAACRVNRPGGDLVIQCCCQGFPRDMVCL